MKRLHRLPLHATPASWVKDDGVLDADVGVQHAVRVCRPLLKTACTSLPVPTAREPPTPSKLGAVHAALGHTERRCGSMAYADGDGETHPSNIPCTSHPYAGPALPGRHPP